MPSERRLHKTLLLVLCCPHHAADVADEQLRPRLVPSLSNSTCPHPPATDAANGLSDTHSVLQLAPFCEQLSLSSARSWLSYDLPGLSGPWSTTADCHSGSGCAPGGWRIHIHHTPMHD
eukprot:CAMPEP_0115169374 /NCGR_PEP_ID=MMETSP0270-20121206/1236_1 /TAXON_ID=71861 /ORGANISM="Scrippsiella trochoidea, Strain CCMP3099" /LENGTH=118 /DNA_ID=CAMNT_0002582071 /DNA_START=275 /DNA_END=631 /DNA_ORIENTATION=-